MPELYFFNVVPIKKRLALFAEDNENENLKFGIGWKAARPPSVGACVAGATDDEETRATDLMASANVGQRSLHWQLVQVRASSAESSVGLSPTG